jgi:glycosyltransferase involved in cell wall biosynthesis
MKKSRIAFVICKHELFNWGGGISYFKNLFELINNSYSLDLMIFTDDKNFVKDRITRNNKVIEVSFLKKDSVYFFISKFINFIFNKNIFLYLLLLKNKVNVLSHRRLFKNRNIKVIGWIPDLQNKVYPNFFPKATLQERENYIYNEINNTDKIFVSSNQIKKEFKKYYKLQKNIIPFRMMLNLSKKKNKINIQKKFIYFPSQFWVHKNHIIILDAIKELKKKRIKIQFIFSGNKKDYRSPNHFNKLKQKINELGINKEVKILSNISEKQKINLQSTCVAMISPSYYEGWSTINEEARTLNKYIFLSNIPGHIEQRNSGSIYFPPNNAHILVKKIKSFLKKKNYLNESKLEKKNKLLYNKIKNEAVRQLLKVYKSK